jgi:hypothetical protein
MCLKYKDIAAVKGLADWHGDCIIAPGKRVLTASG